MKTKYEKLSNVYDYGFKHVCECCNESYPTYSVKMEGESYDVHLNNKQIIHFFNSNRFKSIKYNTIKRVELDINNNIITLHRTPYRINVEFKSKKAKHIYYRLCDHMNAGSNLR